MRPGIMVRNNEDQLRFGLGALVDCRTGAGWVTGKVVQLHYRQFDWGQRTAPYQVRLPTGQLIYAPQDTPDIIKPAAADTAWKIALAALESAMQLLREQGTLPAGVQATLSALTALTAVNH
jgi:hypothetical protein